MRKHIAGEIELEHIAADTIMLSSIHVIESGDECVVQGAVIVHRRGPFGLSHHSFNYYSTLRFAIFVLTAGLSSGTLRVDFLIFYIMVGRVKRSTLRTNIRERLLEAILRGELSPGDRIIEGKLANELGVAKTSLREALQDLEHQGLVMKFENRGTYVTDLKLQEIEDIYDVRLRLEPEAAARAGRRLTPQQTSKLAAFIERMGDTGTRQDFYGFFSSDLAFHSLIWESSGNAALQRALEAVSVPLFAFSGLQLVRIFSRVPSDLVIVCNDHRALLDALKHDNPDYIRKVFTEKLQVFRRQNVEAARTLKAEKLKMSERDSKQENHPTPSIG